MKIFILTLCALGIMTQVYSQKTEYGCSLNSGLFSFKGKSAVRTTYINYSPDFNAKFTINPFGAKNGACIGISGWVQNVTPKSFILGVDFGYENLKSRVAVDRVYTFKESTGIIVIRIPGDDWSKLEINTEHKVKGKTILRIQGLNLYPYIGHRFAINEYHLDLTAGFEVEYIINATEKANASGEGLNYSFSNERKLAINLDYKPRLQLSVGHKRFGIYTGYSLGIKNYKSIYINESNKFHSSLIRFGVTYHIK